MICHAEILHYELLIHLLIQRLIQLLTANECSKLSDKNDRTCILQDTDRLSIIIIEKPTVGLHLLQEVREARPTLGFR